MAFLHIDYFSNTLGRETQCALVMPRSMNGHMPVLYYLHGYSGNHSDAARFSATERYADEAGVIIVFPEGGKHFYADAPHMHANYESHILETVDFIDERFRTRAERQTRAICGLSMGGYGAVKLALKHPHLFSAAYAHSAVFDIHEIRENPNYAILKSIFPDGVPESDDCFQLINGKKKHPAIGFDCGTQDQFLEHSERFHRHLDEHGIQHSYKRFDGGHDWQYWNEHMPRCIQFCQQHCQA